ncbi:MAG: hypothetical protein PHQ86_08565 [Dehalococcoidales bacterium]|nr:hypothetical protein [Dehalococcoidales bacterium]
MILDSSCVHWWIIDSYSVGHYRKCGAIRDFEGLRQKEKIKRLFIREISKVQPSVF